MSGNHTSSKKQRKIYTSLLISMLVIFFLVYNRKSILRELYPEREEEIYNPNVLRQKNPANLTEIDRAISFIENGYLIVKTGTDSRSKLFMEINRQDKTFSHAGLVFIENNYPFVYHMVPGSPKQNGGLRRDSISNYIDPYNTLGFGIYKLPITNKQADSMYEIVKSDYKKGMSFDPYFDLKTDSTYYNAEFIYHTLQKATGNKNFFSITLVSQYEFVTIDALFLRPNNKLIFKSKYK